MNGNEENREYLRAAINVFINEGTNGSQHLARAVNISERGMRYIKPVGPVNRTDTNVMLEFCIPGEEEPLSARGTVVGDGFNQTMHATSVSFDEKMNPEDVGRIRDYVIRRKRAELFEELRREHVGNG